MSESALRPRPLMRDDMRSMVGGADFAGVHELAIRQRCRLTHGWKI